MAHEGVPHVLTVTKMARFKKNWMPPESWPLWGIIGAATVLCAGYTVRLYGFHPDYIWNPKKRGTSRINDDMAEGERYYKHAGRVAPYVTRMEPGYYFAFMRLISGAGWVPPPLPIGILHRKSAMAHHIDHVFEMPPDVIDYYKSVKAGKGGK